MEIGIGDIKIMDTVVLIKDQILPRGTVFNVVQQEWGEHSTEGSGWRYGLVRNYFYEDKQMVLWVERDDFKKIGYAWDSNSKTICNVHRLDSEVWADE